MNCSTPGLPVPHHLPEFAQVHVHRWCCPAISSSDTLFFCPQSFPASGTFPVSFLFASDDQNTGTSASAPVLPMNIQGWSPLWLPNLISLLSNGLSGSLQHHGSKASILWHSAFFTVHLSQPYVTTGKTIVLTVRTFVGRVKSLLFDTLSGFVTSNRFACTVVSVAATWWRCGRQILCRPASSTHMLLT